MKSQIDTKNIVIPRAKGLRVSNELKKLLSLETHEFLKAYSQKANLCQNDVSKLDLIFNTEPKAINFCGVDIMFQNTAGQTQIKLIEVNSAPGFAYCTPELDVWKMAYLKVAKVVVENTPKEDWSGLAVITESRVPIETKGFSQALEYLTGFKPEILHPKELLSAEKLKVGNELVLKIRGKKITGGIRYIHNTPWEYLPTNVKGFFISGTKSDLKGGRNKIEAYYCYERFHRDYPKFNFKQFLPKSFVVKNLQEKNNLPYLGDLVVIKPPYGSGGVGIQFIDPLKFDWSQVKFPILVQEMLRPNQLKPIFVYDKPYAFDLRIILIKENKMFRPIMIYGRHAPCPLSDEHQIDIKQKLMVNISQSAFRKKGLDYDRLILPDEKGWKKLDISFQDWKSAVGLSILAASVIESYGKCKI